MQIDTTLVVEILLISGLLMGAVGYVLGKRKTHKPVLTAVSLAVSCIVPIVALIYLVVLISKPNLPVNNRK